MTLDELLTWLDERNFRVHDVASGPCWCIVILSVSGQMLVRTVDMLHSELDDATIRGDYVNGKGKVYITI